MGTTDITNRTIGYWSLLRTFPKLVLFMMFFLLLDVGIVMLNVVSVAPIADLLLNKPESEWLQITKFFKSILGSIGIDLTLISSAVIIWISLIGVSAITILTAWSGLKIRFAVMQHLIAESYEKLYASRWEFFLSVRKGELMNTFIALINQVGVAFFNIGQLVASLVRLIATVLVPAIIAPKLVFYCIIALAVVAIPFLMLSRYSYALGKETTLFGNRYVSLTRESLEGAREILSFASSKQTIKQLLSVFSDVRWNQIKVRLTNSATTSLYEPVAFLVIIFAIIFSSQGVSDLSKLSIVLWGFMRAIPQIKGSISLYHQLSTTLPSLEQVREQQALADSWQRVEGTQQFEGLKQQISIDNISYSYPDGHSAIANISMEIPKGKVVCLVGDSGSGKSTVIDCAIGLLKPASGNVYYDKVEINDLIQDSLRSKVAVVSQKPTLFDLSIRDNLLWANPIATEAELWQVCEVAGAVEFVKTFDKGIDTILGESGTRLSGGQVQRLSLARALVRSPELLVLDEATNALDSINESNVYKKMFGTYPDMTVLMIAHNMATAAKADIIYVMQDGAITATGDYKTLLNTNAYFKRLAGSKSER